MKTWIVLFVSAFMVQAAPNEPTLRSLRILPETPALHGMGATQRVVVLGTFTDGMERDVTAQSKFQTSDPSIFRVDTTGKLYARDDGGARLSASTGDVNAVVRVSVAGSQDSRPFSFARDIGGIFTRRGCNGSDCHGSVKGKGGLKLSANALYPKDDYRWIVEGGEYKVLTAESGPKVPRIDKAEPERSLLLAKPTNMTPHGGGRRFTKDAPDYNIILEWIRSGAPYGADDEGDAARIIRLEPHPSEIVLDGNGKQQLLVTAVLSNGTREDVTEQVRYTTNNAEVAKVSAEGVVSAVATGEAAVMVRASGQAVSIGIGVIAKPLGNYPRISRSNFIDDFVNAKLKRFNIIPSERSRDAEFLRRICVDLTGTLPPAERVREFLKTTAADKRTKLIETLLASEEYVDYWTFRFADLFRVNYEQGGLKYSRMYWEWSRDNIARNRPYNEVAHERISAQGFDGPSRHFWAASDLRPAQDIMAEQVRVFLGRRLDCAQCHNHPYETWSQDQYWETAAFFARLTQFGDLGGNGDPIIVDDAAGHGDRGQGAKILHPRTKQEVSPKFLNGPELPSGDMIDPRLHFSNWVTSKDNPYFAEAIVNRMWSYFMGRGLVEPVDDFRLTNPPTHPGLLAALSKNFVEHGYDLKHLIRVIVQSDAYQRSSAPNDTNRQDRINYSRFVPRPLDAEVLLDALSTVTRTPERFPKSETSPAVPFGTRAINLMRPEIPSQFLEVYGRPNRLTVPQRKVEPNLRQALHLLAGSTYTQKIGSADGRLAHLMATRKADGEVVEELYLAALARLPSSREFQSFEDALNGSRPRSEVMEDILWAILASREFAYNH